MGTTELERQLTAALGPTLVATLAGDGDTRPANLSVAWRAWRAVSEAEDPDTARNWFIASNPLLDDDPPALAIRDGRHAQVVAASNAMVTGDWVG